MNAEDIKRIIESGLLENGQNLNGEFSGFVFGEYKRVPNTQGTFQFMDKWFIYETDEKNLLDINGPFTAEEDIYAIATLMHASQYFEKYKFGEETFNIFIDNHFSSLEEIEHYLSK